MDKFTVGRTCLFKYILSLPNAYLLKWTGNLVACSHFGLTNAPVWRLGSKNCACEATTDCHISHFESVFGAVPSIPSTEEKTKRSAEEEENVFIFMLCAGKRKRCRDEAKIRHICKRQQQLTKCLCTLTRMRPEIYKKLTLNMEDIEKTIQTDKMGLDNCFIMAKVECYPRKTHLSPIELTTLMTVNKFATRSLAMNHRLGRSPNDWSRSKININILI